MSQKVASELFNSRILSVLDDIEYRRIDLPEEIQEIGRVRSDAYAAANLLTPDGKPLIDEVDFDSHSYVFGVHYKGSFVSTVRLHHVTPDHRVTTTFSIFPGELHNWLDDGKSFIDPVRLAADMVAMKEAPSLPYVTLRLAVLGAIHLKTDYVIQACTPQHSAFYRRVFKGKQFAEATITDSYNIPIGLYATIIEESREAILARFPFFLSSSEEREALFDRSGGRQRSRAIRPTARESLAVV